MQRDGSRTSRIGALRPHGRKKVVSGVQAFVEAGTSQT